MTVPIQCDIIVDCRPSCVGTLYHGPAQAALPKVKKEAVVADKSEPTLLGEGPAVAHVVKGKLAKVTARGKRFYALTIREESKYIAFLG